MQQTQATSEVQGISAPVISPANRVSVTVQATDLILSLGITRLAFDNQGSQVGVAVQYIGSYCLSPTTAKQLAEILRITISKYEAEWGAIPMDSATAKKFEEMANEPLDVKRDKAAAKKAAKTVRVKR